MKQHSFIHWPDNRVSRAIRPALLIVIFIAVTQAAIAGVFNIRDFGAVGDGTTLDTHAIQKTIETCAADALTGNP